MLKTHRIRRFSVSDVLDILRAPALPVAPGRAEAAQAHVALLLTYIRVLAEQLKAGARGSRGRAIGCGDCSVATECGRQDDRVALCGGCAALGYAR